MDAFNPGINTKFKNSKSSCISFITTRHTSYYYLICRTTAGIGDSFVTKTGYAHTAEANNIIIIFPQAIAMGTTNPSSCFDWWGYLNANFGMIKMIN